MKIIKFRKEKLELLTKELQELYENAKISDICKEKLKIVISRRINIVKLEIIVIIQENIEVLRIAYVI